MVRKVTLFLLLAALSVGAAAQTPAPAAAPALTLDQVLVKYIQARGGMDKLKKVSSIRMTGKMALPMGIEAPVVLEMKRPNSVRIDISIQGMTITQAFDGKTGWMIMPLQGNKDPQPMGEDDMKSMADQADFDGMLIDYQQKGNKVELLGKEPVEGGEAYKLKVITKSGDVHTVYLDADAFLEVKSVDKRTVRGTEQETQSIIGDYKDIEGLMIPFSIEQSAKDQPQAGMKMTIEKVELNATVDDARFKMPAVPKPETPAEPKAPGL